MNRSKRILKRKWNCGVCGKGVFYNKDEKTIKCDCGITETDFFNGKNWK